ncbi:MAG: site-specific integrase [Anaerolineales bacterium]|nr:site-specific integrase [Anaerolineales bacterium]
MLSEIERFVKWARRRNPQARTWRDYGYDMRQFVQVVGNRSPREVTFRDVDAFIVFQVKQGFKPTTINRRLSTIISLYNFLSADDNTLVCPVIPHRHLLRESRRLPRPVQEADLQRFFGVITDVRDRAMFLLMLSIL